MERRIIVHRKNGLDMTVVHAIVNEASRFYASTEVLYNNKFVNVKSMKNSFEFFQQPFQGELIITCQGYDEFYALNQMVSVFERYLGHGF